MHARDSLHYTFKNYSCYLFIPAIAYLVVSMGVSNEMLGQTFLFHCFSKGKETRHILDKKMSMMCKGNVRKF